MMRVGLQLLTVGSCRHPACMVTGRLGPGVATFPAMVGLIRHPTRGAILFDTGYGAALAASRDPLARLYRRLLPYQLGPGEACVHQLAAAGIGVGDLHGIILSHLHPDHAGGLRDFPGVPIHLTRRALDSLSITRTRERLRLGLLKDLFPDDMASRVALVDDHAGVSPGGPWAGLGEGRDLFGDGSVVAVDLPGHAPGQIGLTLTLDNDRAVLLAADAVWQARSFRECLEPLRPARYFIHDYPVFLETLHRLHRVWRDAPDAAIIPSHCEETLATVGQRPDQAPGTISDSSARKLPAGS